MFYFSYIRLYLFTTYTFYLELILLVYLIKLLLLFMARGQALRLGFRRLSKLQALSQQLCFQRA